MRNGLIILMMVLAIGYMFVLMFEKYEKVSAEQQNRIQQEQKK